MRAETAAAIFSMSQAADRIAEVTFGASLERMKANWVMQSAIERQFEIMGEALARIRTLEEPVYDRIPDAAKIVGLRNVIIHGYDAVDPAVLWSIVEDRLSQLRRLLGELLAEAQEQGL